MAMAGKYKNIVSVSTQLHLYSSAGAVLDQVAVSDLVPLI